MKTCNLSVITIGIWLFSIVWPLPYAWNMSFERMPGLCGHFCVEAWVRFFEAVTQPQNFLAGKN